MSGTEETFHYTHDDTRKLESRESKQHGGHVPKDSEASLLKSIIDEKEKSKGEIIAERQANLPLPEQPPVASDWNSSDARTVNVGAGRVEDDISTGGAGSETLREPATGDSSVRTDGETFKTNAPDLSGVGRQGVDNLDGLPKDAVAR